MDYQIQNKRDPELKLDISIEALIAITESDDPKEMGNIAFQALGQIGKITGKENEKFFPDREGK